MDDTAGPSVAVTARGYETDFNGHVAAAVLLQYAQHARWECLRSAGADPERLVRAGTGPVSLEERLRFHRELGAGERVTVSCDWEWSTGKTFRVRQQIRRDDGELVAEVTNVGGVLDLQTRRLVPDPGAHWRAVASAPERLGL